MALWAVGAVINVIGSILINLGTNVIKLGHTRTATLAEGKPPKLLRQPRRWWRTPGRRVWLGGMAAFSVGNLLNFASFAFAAQSLLSALGVVQFISNIVFGRFVNKEKVTKRVLFATAVVCVGCVLLVSFGNHESPTLSTEDMLHLYSAPLYITYLCFIFTCAPVMYFVYRHGKRAVLADETCAAARRWARWLPISYALFAGVLGTQSVLYGKTMSMLLRTTFSGDSQFDSWYTYISIFLFLLFAGFWMSRYSKAMKLFPVLIIMPIIQIVWILFSMISGSLYYQEYKTLTALSGTMFGVGVVVQLAGVYLLTGGQAALAQAPAPLRPELKLELSDEERERADELDQAALRTKAPLSDNLEALEEAASGGVPVEVSVSRAQDLLEPEEAMVARKLSNVYDRRSTQSLHSLAALSAAGSGGGGSRSASPQPGGRREGSVGRQPLRPASAPAQGGRGEAAGAAFPGAVHHARDESGASQGSKVALVGAGAIDSSAANGGPWPAANGSAAADAAGDSPPGRQGLSEVVVSRLAEGTEEEGSAGQEVAGGSPPPASLMHDLRSDWGVGMRDLNAVVRASVGLPQDDEEGTAFSLWSMPMASSFTAPSRPHSASSRARSLELARPTFRLRTAFDQLALQAATTDNLPTPGGRPPGRPGHRRLNRSRSANELDDILRAAALAEGGELGGGAASGAGPSPLGPWGNSAGSGGGGPGAQQQHSAGGSPWQAGSSTASPCGAASSAAAGGGVSSGGMLPSSPFSGGTARHRPHPSSGSAPALSSILLGGSGHGAGAFAAGQPGQASPGDVRMLSSAGSAPRRPWAAEPAAGLSPLPTAAGLSPITTTAGLSPLSTASFADESEGPGGAGVGSPPQGDGGLPISDFLPGSSSMSVSFSPPGSTGDVASLASRGRSAGAGAGKKGDKAS